MIIELLNEIRDLRAHIMNMEQWIKLQVESYKNQNEQLGVEIRTLVVQSNILAERIRFHEKRESKKKALNKHF